MVIRKGPSHTKKAIRKKKTVSSNPSNKLTVNFTGNHSRSEATIEEKIQQLARKIFAKDYRDTNDFYELASLLYEWLDIAERDRGEYSGWRIEVWIYPDGKIWKTSPLSNGTYIDLREPAYPLLVIDAMGEITYIKDKEFEALATGIFNDYVDDLNYREKYPDLMKRYEENEIWIDELLTELVKRGDELAAEILEEMEENIKEEWIERTARKLYDEYWNVVEWMKKHSNHETWE